MRYCVRVKKEKAIYAFYYECFYSNFKVVQKNKDSLILCGLFIHLTFESLVTFKIRTVVNILNNPSARHLWFKIFETEKLTKKLDFFEGALLKKDEKVSAGINDLKHFVRNDLSPLRNKIVHGHELSETMIDNKKMEESKLSMILTEDKIDDLYDKFWKKTEIFLNLFKEIDFPRDQKISSEFISKDVIESTRNVLKSVEEENQGTCPK